MRFIEGNGRVSTFCDLCGDEISNTSHPFKMTLSSDCTVEVMYTLCEECGHTFIDDCSFTAKGGEDEQPRTIADYLQLPKCIKCGHPIEPDEYAHIVKDNWLCDACFWAIVNDKGGEE